MEIKINDPFHSIIERHNPDIAQFMSEFDSAICFADDIMDHKVHTKETLNVLFMLNHCFKYFSDYPKLYYAIKDSWETLLYGELEDLNFVPNKSSKEENILLWSKRGFRASLSFDSLCFCDESFNTEENRKWVLDCQFKGLILNDCSDIINEEYEDFIQVRRNFVALNHFSQDIYFKWRSMKEELKSKAQHLMGSVKFSKPEDSRLEEVYFKIINPES